MEGPELLLRFGGAYASLPLVPFPRWVVAVRREAPLTLWPLLQEEGAAREKDLKEKATLQLRQDFRHKIGILPREVRGDGSFN